MIPSIFTALGRSHARQSGEDPSQVMAIFRRQSAAVIGIAGSIGAFGGFLIQVVFRQASLATTELMTTAAKTIHDKHELALVKASIAHAHENWSVPALWAFLAVYLTLGAVTIACYILTSVESEPVPELAPASV
jgi:NNP family nitrate/nitrite transporter-like MFS transporter